VKLWIIGCQGMLGSSLLECCIKKGIEAVGTTRAQADVTDIGLLMSKAKEIQPTHIVNCAAFTDVDGAEKTPEAAFAINAQGAANIALTAKSCGARLIHISTDYVFDGKGKSPYREEDTCNPMNVYGRSKWEGEKKVLEILSSACILRTSWIFGLKGKNFISSVFKWLKDKEELLVVQDQCGKPTYCEDLSLAILNLLNYEGIVHFANEKARSRYEIAIDVMEGAKKQGIPLKCQKIVPVLSAQFPTVAARPDYSVLDTSKYCHVTNLKPRPWDEVINEFIYHAQLS
jgi:dTDP-4-dehydrorhamnose reductase